MLQVFRKPIFLFTAIFVCFAVGFWHPRASAQVKSAGNAQAASPVKRIVPSPLPPGPDTPGGYLLPNGWKLTPAGDQIPLGDLPLRVVIRPDGKFLVATNNGDGEQGLTVVDLERQQKVLTVPLARSWLGLQFSGDGKRLYVSGGGDNKILVYDFGDKGLQALSHEIVLGDREQELFPAGVCVDKQEKRLYTPLNLSNELAVIDLKTRSVAKKIAVGDHPYTCVVSGDGNTVYVSNWGSRSVSEVDTVALSEARRIEVGDHPNDMILSPNGRRLYVANANSNSISVIDPAANRTVETISVALYPKSPIGSTTNALAMTRDGKRLYAANADNNAVAVIRLAGAGRVQSVVEGFIPVGWYPTALALDPEDRTLYVAGGKGLRSKPNLRGPNPYMRRTKETEYIGQLFTGTLSVIPVPDAAMMKKYTAQVYSNSLYKPTPRTAPVETAVPRSSAERSPIRHVIYVIKENRTYDQVFGDIKEGNGDPGLVLFGEDVTPNHHALVREFVLLDNFYADAEVSADGHNWSMAAYATDYVEKTWPTNYSNRGRGYDYEGGVEVSKPSKGFLWDYAARAGLSYRSYGEFIAASKSPDLPSEAREKSLEGHFDPMYRPWDLNYPDVKRVEEFLREFREFEKNNDLPRLMILRLPSDHTEGTSPGRPTPRAFVAENDLALGQLVEAVSHSKYWKDTAIFSVEDDAQNGPDHVDAHRTVALVVSAYTKRHFVDSTLYSTSSMLRTIELILGLPPMSQFDAAATPMWNSFTKTPQPEAFKSLPARVPLDEKNPENAPGAKRSAAMDFSKEDSAPDIELNEVIWESIKGEHSEMPAPVRTAWVRPNEEN
jgi:YVTN family beta-propeller protein